MNTKKHTTQDELRTYKIKIHPVTKHSQGLFEIVQMTLECKAHNEAEAIAYAKEAIDSLQTDNRLTYSVEDQS